jgi:serine/threonine-protein kinase
MSILDYDVFDFADQIFSAYPEPAPFEDFGPYRIVKLLGKGGMGEVFLAEDIAAGRRVALKFMSYVWRSPDLHERFAREIKTLAKLEHPFIARLYDAGIHPGGTPYFAMEYVEGKPLDEYCREQQCSLEQRLHLLRSVCDAVQYAHTHLVIHRDLKPSNILVKADGTPKLLDFGIAKQLDNVDEPANQTRTQPRFTRAFAAPEQFRSEPVGVYTDVYALGMILYQLLARRPPYDLDHCTPVEAENLIAGEHEPPRPSASPTRMSASKAAWSDLDVLCLKAIKKDVSRRYRSVIELTQDIDRFLKGEPLKARPDTLTYRLGKFARRNRRTLVASALAFAAVLAMVIFFTLRLAQERDRAVHETAIVTSMNRFLSDDLLGRSDPFKSSKVQESFTEAVGRAALQIDNQFPTEPLVAANLHETIAKAFENRSDFPRARQEYRRATDLFERAQGPFSQHATVLRLRRAVMEAISGEPGSLTTAQALVSEAKSTMSRIASPRDDLAVWLPYAQGAIAIVQNDAHSANAYFSAALNRAETNSSLDAVTETSMKQMVAFSYIRLAEGAKAEPLLRQVIAAYSKRYGSDSPDVLRARTYLAQAFMVQGKYSEAVNEVTRIYPTLLARLGQDNQITMAALGTRAASEGYLDMWDAGARDDLTLYNTAVRKQQAVSYLSLGSLSDAGLSECRAGRYAEGEMHSRKAYEASKRAFGPRAGLTGGSAYSLAFCLIGLNKLPEASEVLRDIDSNAVTQLSGDSTVTASIALAQGQIAARRGDYTLAQHYLAIAAPTFERPKADPLDKKTVEELKSTIDSHLHASR